MKSFLQRLAAAHPLRFGVLMTAVALFIKIPFGPLIVLLPGGDTTGDLLELGLVALVVSFLILPIETLLGQMLPIGVLGKFRVRRWRTLMVGSAICFGLLHLPAGVGAFFVGFSGGLAFAVCWLCWTEVSLKRAFWGTTLVHAAHNGVALCLFFAFSL